MSYKTKFSLFIAIFLWASAFVGIRAGMQGYSPEGLALLRFIIASICMGIVYYWLPQRTTIKFQDICILLGLGMLGIGIYSIMLNYGELSISSGMSSFIISQSPVITTFIAMLFLGERLNLSRAMGFIISVLGVAIISIGEGGFSWSFSLTYILIATAISSLYSVMQKPLLKRYHAIEVTTYMMWGATLFLLLYTPQLRHDFATTASLKSTLVIAYLGIFPGAIGYIAWSYALSNIPVARAVSFYYFMPFLATILGWLWLSEVPTLVSVGGGLLAIMGVVLVNQSYRQRPLLSLVNNEAEEAA
jgi:drug/metabolite transporter (DMT)-like permease